MEREKSRRRASSRVARPVADDDDTRSVASSSMFTAKSFVSIGSDSDGILFKVVELCADTLVDRFLEFDSGTIVIRTYDGPDQAGPAIAMINSPLTGDSNDFSLLHYDDTDFFHVLEKDSSVLLCTPTSSGQRFVKQLQALLEKAVGTSCVRIPIMSMSVKFSLPGLAAVSAYCSKKTSSVAPTVNDLCLLPAAAFTERNLRETVDVKSSQSSVGQENLSGISLGSSAGSLVGEFCLLFHQSASQTVLLHVLGRINTFVKTNEIPRRIGPSLDSFFAMITPMLDVLWKCSPLQRAVRDEIAAVLFLLTTHIIDSETAFLFSAHAQDALRLMVAIFCNSELVRSWTASTRLAVISLFALCNSFECTKELRQALVGNIGEVLAVASSISLCCRDAFEHLNVHHPKVEFMLLVGDIAKAISFLSPPDPSALKHTPSARSVRELNTLWSAFPTCLETLGTLIEDAISVILYRSVGVDHQALGNCITTLTEAVTYALRTLLTFPPAHLGKLLIFAAPSIGAYFRRFPSWCDYVGITPVPGSVLRQGLLFVAVVSLARLASPNHLPFIQHEWLSKISILSGPLGARAFISELQFIFKFFTEWYPECVNKDSQSCRWLQSIFKDVLTLCELIAKSAPSPSLLLSCWETCSTVALAFSDVADEPLLLSTRLRLARLLLDCGLGSTANEDRFVDELPHVGHRSFDWDDIASFREISAQSSAKRKLSSRQDNLPLHISLVLFYVLPALENEKLLRRWNTFASHLFEVAQFLAECNASHSLTTSFVLSAVSMSKKLHGVDENSLIAMCQRYVIETFVRVTSNAAWNLSSSLRSDQEINLPAADNTVSSSDQQSVTQELSDSVVVLGRRKKDTTNLLYKLASSYKLT